jgi:hypothetical protein
VLELSWQYIPVLASQLLVPHAHDALAALLFGVDPSALSQNRMGPADAHRLRAASAWQKRPVPLVQSTAPHPQGSVFSAVELRFSHAA